MSDTPIADEVAERLEAGWVVHQWPDHQEGQISEGTQMSEPTPEQIKQMRAGAERLAQQGVDTQGIDAVIDLVTGVDPGPQ